MPAPEFKPGFRLPVLDRVTLALGTIAAIVLGTLCWQASLVVVVVVSSFFLFCNVFRIARRLELIWASVFVAASTATILWGVPGWIVTVSVAAGTAALVVALEMRKPSYHGVGWRRINPGLREWWDGYVRNLSAAEIDHRNRK
jgi:hypothetical protein